MKLTQSPHARIFRHIASVLPVLAISSISAFGATGTEYGMSPGDAPPEKVPGCSADSVQVPPGPPPSQPGISSTFEVRVLYFIPTDLAYDPNQEARILQTSEDVHRWYADHTDNGKTLLWTHDVDVVYGYNPSTYYQSDLWGTVLSELGGRGYPIWSPGKVFAIWVTGGGLYAGGATWYGWTGNAVLGSEIFLQDGCQPSHPSNWPCTPGGAMAHELGHAFGLPHPDAAGAWLGYNLNDNSLMGSHWNFPERDPRTYTPPSPWGLLNYERDHLRYNPLFGDQGSPYPALPGDPMEMPALPNPPLVLSVEAVSDTETRLTWNDDGAAQYYAYWSQAPDLSSYTEITGSPTTGTTLTLADSGEQILYFKVFEIPLSD